MKIRLMGTRPELSGALVVIRKVFKITNVSRLYANRNNKAVYRVYIEIEGLNLHEKK